MIKKITDSSQMSDPDQLRFDGEHIFTDGCYMLSDEVWQECIEFWDWDKTNQAGHDWIIIEVDGHKIAMFSTAYGDGSYVVVGSGVYGEADVDSGSLAIIPVALNPDKAKEVEKQGSGKIVDIHGYFECPERGIALVDHISIDTKNEQEDEDEEDEWEEDEDEDDDD